MSNPANATLGTNVVHTVTIQDDDSPPDIDFDLKKLRILICNDLPTDGKSVYAKQIMADPEAYFSANMMAMIDEYLERKYSYGTGSEMASEDINTEESA